jgi:uncharacterized membrane protein YkoI
MRTVLLIGLAATACAPRPAATPAATVLLGDCVTAVQAVHQGTMVKVEGTVDSNRTIYEFDVRSPDGTQWDIECDANTGKIVEVEQEVSGPDQEPFKARVQIREDSARAIALAANPGEISEVEYEVEADGAATYEFDVKGADGKETKVEVDATTGRITEANPEYYQIGVE